MVLRVGRAALAATAAVRASASEQRCVRALSSWGGADSSSRGGGGGGRGGGSSRDNSARRDGGGHRRGGGDWSSSRGGGGGDRRGGGDRGRWSSPTSGERKTVTNDGEPIPQLRGEGVYGLHSVLQVLESEHRRIHKLYVRDPVGVTAKKTAAETQALEKIKALADANGVEMATTSKWMLNHITSDKPHQGVVLDADPISLPEFEPVDPSVFVTSSRQPVILALDELHDPQNLGAILRSAHFLGCSAVLISERNSAPLSPAASRASAGAMEVLVANNKLFKARNLHEALAVSSDLGWRVVGACSGPNSVTSNELGSDQPTILVMGNEHRGMRKGIRQTCSDIVTIPGQAADEDSRVDSLNVSVAAAILLYELLHR
ncbi:hypothetical protein Gpo141_00004854 [Globisporangium polare]